MRLMATFTLVASGFLAGCESYDLGQLSTLAPGANAGEFHWQTIADVNYPIDDAGAEEARMRQLGVKMQRSKECPQGYSVVDRRSILVREGALGDVYDLFYTIRCK